MLLGKCSTKSISQKPINIKWMNEQDWWMEASCGKSIPEEEDAPTSPLHAEVAYTQLVSRDHAVPCALTLPSSQCSTALSCYSPGLCLCPNSSQAGHGSTSSWHIQRCESPSAPHRRWGGEGGHYLSCFHRQHLMAYNALGCMRFP